MVQDKHTLPPEFPIFSGKGDTMVFQKPRAKVEGKAANQ